MIPAGAASAATAGTAATAPVPATVRKEGAGAVRGYRAALEFESMLLKQMLSEALPEAAAGAGAESEGEGGAPGADPRMASFPETVTEAVVGAGGLGLAREMYKSFAGGR